MDRPETSVERWPQRLRLGVLVLIFWLPLPYGSNRVWSESLFVLLVGLLTIGWGLAALRHPHRMTRGLMHGPGAAMVLALLAAQGWVALQWGTGISMDPGMTMRYLLHGLGLLGLFVLVVTLFTERAHLTQLMGVVIVSGLLQGFFGAAQVLAGNDWWVFEAGTRVSGSFVNANHAANFLAMTLSVGTGLLLALRAPEPFRWWRLPDWLLGPKAWIRISLVIMVIALVMTHSRMGNIAFFSSLLVAGGLFLLLQPVRRFRSLILLTSVLLIDMLIISQYFGLENLRDRLVDTRLNDEIVAPADLESAAQSQTPRIARENVIRDDVLVYALPQFQHRPWRGYGAGAFESTFQRFPGADVTQHWNHAHLDPLQFLIEYGVVGTAPLVAFVFIALWQGLRGMADPRSAYRSGVATGAVMGIVAMLIHGFGDYNLQIPANAATFVVLCAMTVVARTHHRGAAVTLA
ncbi:O-antigen ligase family protein [Spiribacter sp. 221]|uniref:O-antigen ligase family protein n=1 Tax=Spiribacter onubensis TaxID=3122420 RepID=UPI00349F4835